MRSLSVVIALCALLAGFNGCSSRESSTPTTILADSTRPDTQTKGALIDLLDGSRLTARIHADKIVTFQQIDSTMGYGVHADFYDSAGHVTSQLDGDSAIIHENSNHLYVYGRVVVVSEDNSKLETDYLHWNPDVQKIQTDAFVKVTRRSDVITGWGLEADQRLTHIKILRQVSGTIHNSEDIRDQVTDTSSSGE